MPGEGMLHLRLRSQVLGRDADGRALWEPVTETVSAPARRVALVICDMWEGHWSRGAAERVEEMAPRVNRVVRAAREKGVQIIHAPSETVDRYAGTPARERIAEVARVKAPSESEHPDPPLPIDDSDGGSDTGETDQRRAWSRQHPAIEIDQEGDAISDDGEEVYSFLRGRGIEHLAIAGVHTNMCVLNRSFGIKNMVRWGVNVALVRDLTDAMYNPAMRPYVSHEEGTLLVVEYIEKFWCPTIESGQLV